MGGFEVVDDDDDDDDDRDHIHGDWRSVVGFVGMVLYHTFLEKVRDMLEGVWVRGVMAGETL